MKKNKIFKFWMPLLMTVLMFSSCQQNEIGSSETSNTTKDASTSSTSNETQAQATDGKIKVGFVYLSTAGDGGWSYAHDQGRKYLVEKLPNVEAIIVDSVPEGSGDVDRVMEQMIQQGAKVIFATSFGYMDSVINVAAKHPDVYFLHCTGFKQAANVTTYDIREIEGVYMTGVAAGLASKNGKIGYVAAQPIPSVVRAVDSFALGVKSVNPDAKIQLVWTSTWYDPAKEKEAALGLLDTGVDVIAQYQDTPAVQQAAQDKGALSIGFHSDMRNFAPKANITSFLWNWGPFYTQEVQKYLDGTWKSYDSWIGLKEGACDIVPLNADLVSEDLIKQVNDLKPKLINGEINVWAGPIKDNTGKEIVPSGSVYSDGDLRSINWLVDNIEGSLPQ